MFLIEGGMPSSCGMLNKRETEAYKTTCSERIFTMATQINTNQQTELEKQTTKKDIAILFVGDVVVSFVMVKMFLSKGDLPADERAAFWFALCSYAVIGPSLRDGLLRCYKSEKKKDFLRFYLHPWFSIFLISTIELILFACK